MRLQRGPREFLEEGPGVVLGAGMEAGGIAEPEVRLGEAQLGAADEEAFQDGMRVRLAAPANVEGGCTSARAGAGAGSPV